MSKEIDNLLYNVIIYSQGYVKVTNYGGKWAVVEDGVYYVLDRGNKEYPKKTKSQVLEIFKKLIYRYQNFEVKGEQWYYDRGKWVVKSL